MTSTTKHTLSTHQKEDLIRRIVSFLDKERPEILAGYLFGSFATGSAFADIDLAFLLEAAATAVPLEYELKIENQLEQITQLPVDVRVMNHAPLSFQYQVLRDGRLLLDRAPDLRADHEGQTLKQYYEISRYRKRYLIEALHAPL